MAARRATHHLLRVGAGALVASLPLVSYKVYAADGECEPKPAPPEPEIKPRIKITDLSIYDNPEDKCRFRYVQEEISPLRQVVSEARQALWEYLDTIQDTTDKLKVKYQTGKAHTQELIDYIQNDPGMLPRVIVITIAGLGGVIAGYRGGAARKAVYSAAAITAAASLCYPNQAVELTNDAFEYCKAQYRALWPIQEFREGEDQAPEARKVMMDPALSPPTSMPQIKGDPGMSLEEDKDMYTTRGGK